MEHNDVSLAGRLETNTVALLDSLYSQEKSKWKIIYKVVDISKKRMKRLQTSTKLHGRPLFVNGWKDGKENVK